MPRDITAVEEDGCFYYLMPLYARCLNRPKSRLDQIVVPVKFVSVCAGFIFLTFIPVFAKSNLI